MDAQVLSEAITKAIQAGAKLAGPIEILGPDVSWLNTQTNATLEQAAFDAYLRDLRADPDMAAFDGMFANSPFGGGVSVSLSEIARLLLARAIATSDLHGTVERFIAYFENNSADAIAVIAVSGLTVDEEIRFGPHVSLVPVDRLPPSMPRGAALGQDRLAPSAPRFGAVCAFTTKFRYGPIFYRPKTPQPAGEMAAHVSTSTAQSLLEEALNLLSLIGIYPHYHMAWVQPEDWLTSTGITSGYSFSTVGEYFGPAQKVTRGQIEPIAMAYFALAPQLRARMLRIPLDRLSRAGRERDLADRAVDLGIALESLLLHELKDRGELGFRLSLRGAWLAGATTSERLDIQKSLRDFYALRSSAVHSGFVEPSTGTRDTIARAAELCQGLIRKVIELKGQIDWTRVVVGG